MNTSISCIVIGDPHFKINNVRETDEMTKVLIEKLSTIKPTFIVVAGDILDRHEIIHVSPLTRAIDFLYQLTLIAPTYVIIGNHDRKNNRDFLSEEHPFTALKYWNAYRMKIIDTTYATTIGDHLFTFVPYVAPGRFVEALNYPDLIGSKKSVGKVVLKKKSSSITKNEGHEKWRTSTAIFAHQEFYGCKMGVVKSLEGDKWPLENPLVISGHIHEYQEPQANILYVGTPIQHGFGDKHDKTISMFTFTDNNVMNKPIGLESANHVRIDLKLRKKKIIYLSCADVPNYTPPHNFDLKFVIKGFSSEIKVMMKHPNIDKWKQEGYKVVFKDVPLPLETTSDLGADSYVEGKKNRLGFTHMLFNVIKEYPDLSELFSNIFGEIF